MSAILRRKCCCLTNTSGWYTCKPVYCANAFVNEGFPSFQEDAKFMTFLNEADLQFLEEESLFPFGDAVYWHDGIQLWVLDDESDFLGDANSPQFLDPPIFAPDRLSVQFLRVTPLPGQAPILTVLRQPPPPLKSFVTVEENIETTINLGVLLFQTLSTSFDFLGNTYTVDISPDPGPDPASNPTAYLYTNWYRPTYSMATNPITSVNVKGLDIDLEQYYWHFPQPPYNYRECVGNRGSGTHSAPVFLSNNSFAYGPITVDNFYGTDTTYEQFACGLEIKMIFRAFRDLEPQCNGLVEAEPVPYHYLITPPFPDDQDIAMGLFYQEQSPCPDPSFPDIPCRVFCDPDTFIPNQFFGIPPGAQTNDCNRAMEIKDSLCSFFIGAPSSESYVVSRPGITSPNPIDGIRPNDCKAVGRSGTAVNTAPPFPGFSIGEEIFTAGIPVLQPILIT